MRTQQKSILVLATITVFVATALFLPRIVYAGDLEPSAPPASTMHTLDEIYNKLETIDAKLEPCDPCEPCGEAPVAKTGQTASMAAGDDGALQRGIAWPDPRFTDNGDRTVTDNLTGLMWTQNASIYGSRTWADALSDCASCTEGSYSDWGLPNIRELHSLIDYSQETPPLPVGHPFFGVKSSNYWSSTTLVGTSSHVWCVSLGSGHVSGVDKNNDIPRFWCVRGGQ